MILVRGFLNSCARTETIGTEGSFQIVCAVLFCGEIVSEFILRGSLSEALAR
jgi:hypothetical protein